MTWQTKENKFNTLVTYFVRLLIAISNLVYDKELIMNKSLLTCALALLSFTAEALPFDGPYLTGVIGGTKIKADHNQATRDNLINGDTPAFNILENNKASDEDSSIIGGIELGIGKVFAQYYYLALEGSAQFEDIETSSSFDVMPTTVTPLTHEETTKAKLTNELALTFNPGIVINKTSLLYGKIGPAWGRFSSSGNLNFAAAFDPANPVTGQINYHEGGSYKTGLRLGLGIEHYFMEHLSLKLEYLNTNYGQISSGKTHTTPLLVNGALNPDTEGSSLYASDKIKARTNTVMLGLSYRLGASSPAALASTIWATPFDGFYTGADIGISQARFKEKQSTSFSLLIDTSPVSDVTLKNHKKLTDTSFLGNIDIGYGKVLKEHLFLGLEADVDFQNLDIHNKSGITETVNGTLLPFETSVDLKNEFAITFNPGVVLNKTTLLYGKIGPAWGRFDADGSTVYNQDLGGEIGTASASYHDKGFYKLGLRLGLGVEQYVSEHMALKLEVLNTNYNTIHSGSPVNGLLTSNVTPSILSGQISNSDKITANNSSILFGFNYHFG